MASFANLRDFVTALHLQMRKYENDLATLDSLLSKISSKIDTSHLDQRSTMDLTMALITVLCCSRPTCR
jgi:hypothetical protein